MVEIKINKINENEWEIPKTEKMNVPVKIFASEKLLEKMKEDITFQQAQNMAMLPGVVKNIVVCPDAHQGYGACIGGVVAYDTEKGVISPGEIGYDINCSVRVLKTNLIKKDILERKKELLHSIFRSVPSGVGEGSIIKISKQELNEILKEGAQWAVKKGYGEKEDYEHTEDYGKLSPANIEDVSDRAKARGFKQLGSLGSGNHFLEIQEVEEVFDKEIAKKWGLEKGQITIMIHCGSRGLGHQVASDYIKLMEDKYGFENLPDRELINAPLNSELGKKYFSAMNCAANFAFCNKQLITYRIRENLKHYFPNFKADVIYDVCHNIAKIEEHVVDGKKTKLCINRKGATRSFGPGRVELPNFCRETGQPIILPGSMGTASYILVGTKTAEEKTFASTPHGAGRVSSRSAALRDLRGEDIKKQLNDKGIDVEAGSVRGLAEEAPQVYKDIDEVARVSDAVGIGKLVVRLKPLAVMKG